MSTCPTIRVVAATPEGYMVINAEDFIEGTHELFGDTKPQAPTEDDGSDDDGSDDDGSDGSVDYNALSKDDLKSMLDAKGISYKNNANKDELIALLTVAE